MAPQEQLRHIVTPTGLNIRTNIRERLSRKTRAGLVAAGIGEIFIFNETVLGVAVIALGLFADRRGRRGNQIQSIRREVKNNV